MRTRACACALLLGGVGCFCQVAVMNLPAGWPLTGTQGDGWGDNGEDGERKKERDRLGKRCFLEEYSPCDEMDCGKGGSGYMSDSAREGGGRLYV